MTSFLGAPQAPSAFHRTHTPARLVWKIYEILVTIERIERHYARGGRSLRHSISIRRSARLMQRDALLSPQAPPRRRRRAAGARARSASAAGARCVRGISDRGARQRPRSEMLCRGRGATEAVRLGLRHPEPSVFLARLHVNHLSSTSRPTIAIRLRRAGSSLRLQSS